VINRLDADDGIDSAATQHLARQLESTLGYRVVVVAPRKNKSAARYITHHNSQTA
jgi:broad specificity polyphosphatase/5'/3'-nucleotidase SurE